MVGGAVARQLEAENCTVLTAGRDKLDLRDAGAVKAWMAAEKPQAVVLAAAKVGGIVANDTYPADFLFENLAIENAIIHARFRDRRMSRSCCFWVLPASIRSSRPSQSPRTRS